MNGNGVENTHNETSQEPILANCRDIPGLISLQLIHEKMHAKTKEDKR